VSESVLKSKWHMPGYGLYKKATRTVPIVPLFPAKTNQAGGFPPDLIRIRAKIFIGLKASELEKVHKVECNDQT